jgi:propionate CoA-transferase
MGLFKNKRAPALANQWLRIPALVSSVGLKKGVSDFIIRVLQSGPWGGLALSGNDSGLAISPLDYFHK